MNVRTEDLTRYDLGVILDFYRDAYTVALNFSALSATKARSVDKMIKLNLLERDFTDNPSLCRLTEHGKEVIAATVDYFLKTGMKE